uniref:MFS transporter n=1 Tax=Dictyoglomus thermophilum TaxID=14 RepID=A0A7C3RS83_DICTH
MRNKLFIAVLLGSFITSFSASAINVALPAIGKEFYLYTVSLSWLSTLYLLSNAFLLLPFGKIADIYGRKKLFSIGLFVFSIGALISILSFNYDILAFSRIIQGFGGSILFATTPALVSSISLSSERGKNLGYYVTSVYLGLSLGPSLGGFLTKYFSWRSIFIFTLILGMISFIMSLFVEEELEGQSSVKFDLLGSFLYAFSVTFILLGLSNLKNELGIMGILFGAYLLFLFYYVEKKISNPIFPINLFRNRRFIFSNLSAFINYGATSALSFLLSIYLQSVKYIAPHIAGFLLSFQPISQVIFSPWAGRLSDRKDPGIIASLGMLIISIVIFFLSFLSPNTPIFLISLSGFFLGFGFALFSSPNTNAIMGSVDRSLYGVASSTLATMRVLGQTFSMALVNSVFSILLKDMSGLEFSLDFMYAFRILLYIFTLLCALGIWASFQRNKE